MLAQFDVDTIVVFQAYRPSIGQFAVTLAIRLSRPFFDSLLTQAVETSFHADQYTSFQEWQQAGALSNVRMQWDPDHHPSGHALPRRALQLGLRGRVLKEYARHQVHEIIDISTFVAEQHANISSENRADLVTPLERAYFPPDLAIRLRLRLAEATPISLLG
jgi:hypothetical protein